ncbi:MAG TPA: family 16 glycoside hydrolase, partial [Pirellulales bacterium]|nr:family 16 glycoside hydrolase [Pirellulales bacterium]
IQGGRYQRQAGPHINPYTYADIQTIAKHRHWIGATPHSGNNRSDAAGGGHAHAGAMIYLGGSWPEPYRNQIFMNNIHGARLNMDSLAASGSGYVGDRAPDFLLANDAWSQIINLQYGPDGQMYMIDWYDKNQCHYREAAGHDRTNGRIFKVSYQNAKPVQVDLQKKTDAELVALLLEKNEWYVRHARRILQERGEQASLHESLAKLAFEHADETRRLRGLWALHAAGGLSEARIARGLMNDSPYVRAWTIQLALEDKTPSAATLQRLAVMALRDDSPVVRLYLASAADRLPLEARGPIVAGLVRHAEDAGDHNLPLMVWYAAEPLAEVDSAGALKLAEASRIPLVDRFMTRRLAQLGTPEAIEAVVERLGRTADGAGQLAQLQEITEGLKGRRQLPMPPGWKKTQARLAQSDDAGVRNQALALGLTFGDAAAYQAVEKIVADSAADRQAREEALAALLKTRDPGLPPILARLLDDPALRRSALRGLAAYDNPQTPERILGLYAGLNADEKRDALATLASRAEYAAELLNAVGDKRVPAADLSAELVRQIRNLKDERLAARVAEVWGVINDTPAERLKQIAETKKMLSQPPAQPPDVALGRTLFAKTCQQCHVLFGLGGKVGPELTGSNRANLDYILSNLLDPSAVIGKDYQAVVLQTTEGRTLTGLVRAEDQNSLTLATATETVVVPQDEIEAREISAKSMMPDDQLKPLAEHEVRSLIAYLASPVQTPQLAAAENVANFFNGRDLAGWQGDGELWSVEEGQIVGRTRGLARNEFLRSDLAAGDFRLTLEVKLVKNEGNSGVQFRSESLPEGEVKGYQADIGAGWWGKLYEEHGRGLLWDRSGEGHVRLGEWNAYEIVAVGDKLLTSINGQPCVELDDPGGAKRGIFAFQLHSGGATEVRFRNLKLELLEKGNAVAK